MTVEEKKKYKSELVEQCKTYCHIDYDDDIAILELMIDTATEEMVDLIPGFDLYAMTSRHRLIDIIKVKKMYDHREQ